MKSALGTLLLYLLQDGPWDMYPVFTAIFQYNSWFGKTQKRIGMKLILFLHFHVLDSLMQGFPNWPIVTHGAVCGSIYNLSSRSQEFAGEKRHMC